MTSSGVTVPVGLLGVVTNTTSGRCSSIAATAASADRVKSAARGPPTHWVPVPAARIGCIEYDGSNPSAIRPGPPNACSTCCSTSLEPLAAQSCSMVSATPVRSLRYQASDVRSCSASRSG